MKKALTLALSAVIAATTVGSVGLLAGCDNNADDGVFRVGFIFLHDQNSTYDKNFIDAATAAVEKAGLKEDQVIMKTGVPETEECFKAAEQLVKQGCDLIFADSFNHEPYMVQAAQKYPDVEFCHATGVKAHTQGLANYHNAFASIYEGRYLAGVAAGYKLLDMYDTDDDGAIADAEAVLGYVGAYNYAEVVSGYTAWYLGVRSVVSNATMKVRYTESWYDENAENATATTLINTDKCVLISQHADSMGAPNACQTANVPNVAYNGLTGKDTNVASSKIDWTPYFDYIIEKAQKGEEIAADWTGTFATGSVKYELGAAAAEGTADKLADIAAKLADGSLKVFDTSKFTVKGETVTTYLADVDDDGTFTGETEAIHDGAFLESKYRSAPYFDLRIDGITEL